MTELGIGLTRRRALGGVIYLFTQKSIANKGGRIPYVLNNLKHIIASVVLQEPLIDEISLLYREISTDGRSRTLGRVRFAIDWEAHELSVKGDHQSFSVESESMLEEVSPILVELAEYIRTKCLQTGVNDLKFYLGWRPEVLADAALLAELRARLKTAERSDMDIDEAQHFNARRGKQRVFRPGKLSEESVTLEWVDVFKPPSP